jgi:hypothetical protein
MMTSIANSHSANTSDVLARLGLKSVALAQVLVHSSLGLLNGRRQLWLDNLGQRKPRLSW